MAYAEPQSVTINSTAITLPRVFVPDGAGLFRNYDSKTALKIQHAYGRRTRRTASLDFAKITTDPLVATTNVLSSMTARIVLDTPSTGLSAAEQLDVAKALLTWLTAGTNANLIKLVAGEN